MTKIEECRANVDRLYDELNVARTALADAICDASPIKVGDVVMSVRWGVCKVILLRQSYDNIARLTVVDKKLDGLWSKREHEINQTYDLVKS